MTHDPQGRFGAAQLISDTLSDFSDLIKKEVDLAKAEMADKISTKVMGGVWIGIAGFVGLLGLFVVIQAIIFAIASFGIAMYWSCLIVAAGLFVIAGGLFLYGRHDANEDLVPTRSVRQLKRDVATAKEQMQ